MITYWQSQNKHTLFWLVLNNIKIQLQYIPAKMTVIRGKQTYNYPKPNSTAASDTESLHLGSVSASDTESVNDEPHSTNRVRVLRPPVVRLSHVDELINIKKSCGKKKLRRYQNRCVLQTLNEENENENVIILMESVKSPFARLLEDQKALDYWNDFIEKSEEEQTQIVRAFSDRNTSSDITNKKEKVYGRLSSRIRHTIKIKKNLSLETVKGFEDDLIEFFKSTPQSVFVKFPPTSFDRLLLHAVAQYHKLKSISVLDESVGKRSVEVHNVSANWAPADCFLTDFVKQLRR